MESYMTQQLANAVKIALPIAFNALMIILATFAMFNFILFI